MIKKQGNFIEAHIEKLALLIGILVRCSLCISLC